MKREFVEEPGRGMCVKFVVEPADLLRWSNTPERYRAPLLSGSFLHELEPLKAVQRLLAGDGILLVLAGEPGRGKSFAAAYALSQRRGLWHRAPELARPPAEDEPDPVVRLRAVQLLVLDDVGLEHSPGGYALSRILDVLDAREEQELPSIVTTNLSPAGFRDRYGERIASRINGDPIGWITCTGPDLRIRRGLAVAK